VTFVIVGAGQLPRRIPLEVVRRLGREILAPIGTTRQIDHVPHPQAIGDYPQLGAGGRKETAEQSRDSSETPNHSWTVASVFRSCHTSARESIMDAQRILSRAAF
jgi:hypothetical protein